MTIDGFDIFAFIVFAVLLAAVVFIIVELGSLPGQIAAKRGHPYVAAVNAAASIGLVTLGALSPIALAWAFLPWPAARPASDVTAKDRGKAAPSMSFRDLVGLPRLARIPPFFQRTSADRLTCGGHPVLRVQTE